MTNTMPHDEIGGEGIHVRDSYVWMEISYLDSPSDFREYLPQDRQWKPTDDRSFRTLADWFALACFASGWERLLGIN